MANSPQNTSKQFNSNSKLNIKNNIMKGLYLVNIKQIQHKVKNIIERNCVINGISAVNAPFLKHQGIIFEYSTGNQIECTGDFRLKLFCHESLQSELMSCIALHEQITHEQTIISGYLTRLLNIASDLDEVHMLLPAVLNENIGFRQITEAQRANYKYSDKQNVFIQTNEKYVDVIKQRLLTNILIK